MAWLDQAMPFPIPASLLGHSAHALTGGALRDQPAAGLGWALAGAAALALALAAGAHRLRRRAVEAEDAAARARRDLAEAERLAAVGREASQVAHQLANAVAVVRANVRWLAEPDPADDQAERVQAVQETVEAAERIAALAAELRRVSGEPRRPAPRREDGGPGEPG
jgi:C4-dicarboxylate-specific signal transduction histidine kinase